tara:strand:- start:644 stop:1012 length:369 start_codon:yes stop_codon:yes gene_type:complete
MSELGLLEMLFMHVIIGISIFVIVSVVLVIVASILLFIGTIIYWWIAYELIEIAENIAFRIKDFFYPIPRLPEDVRERVLREAADFVRSKHRPWDGDNLFAEYLWVGPERVNLAWEKMYGKK